MKEDITIKYVMLSNMKGIGGVTQNVLLDWSGGIRPLFDIDEDALMSSSLRTKIGKEKISRFLSQRYDAALEGAAKGIVKAASFSGTGILVREDMDYPKRLRDIKDMPIVLYTKGELSINSVRESAAIVGARRCSVEGKYEAVRISAETVSEGGAVISGMAKGIDSYAHTAALKANGYTIAVFGNGADICYPKEHEKLYEAIIKKGCIVTEYPPGTSPRPYNFPRRNRLIAGLSDRLYVIDVRQRSGTVSTVEYAKKYGREVIQLQLGDLLAEDRSDL